MNTALPVTAGPPAAPPDNGVFFVEEIGHLLHASKGNPINTCIQCGTCSTHAAGQMALEVTLVAADGRVVDRVIRA